LKHHESGGARGHPAGNHFRPSRYSACPVTVVSNAKSPLRNRSRRAFFLFSSVVVIRESYYSEIPNGPDCDRSVEILQISYDVSLGKIMMLKWAGTNRNALSQFWDGFFWKWSVCGSSGESMMPAWYITHACLKKIQFESFFIFVFFENNFYQEYPKEYNE
jgi:hypothetical protein